MNAATQETLSGEAKGWPYDGPREYPMGTTQPSPLAAALAKAQGQFATITRDKSVTVTMKSGGKYSFSYAPLESILHAVMPALSANGLAIVQHVVTSDGKEVVRTELMHANGESIWNAIRVMASDGGPQAYGSALTYARRYGITLLLCICADDDDDGNAAEGNQAEVTKSRSNGGSAKATAEELDGPVLTPQKREAYLPSIVTCLNGDDGPGLRQLWDELSPREQSGIWNLFSTKQKAEARALLQKAVAA